MKRRRDKRDQPSLTHHEVVLEGSWDHCARCLDPDVVAIVLVPYLGWSTLCRVCALAALAASLASDDARPDFF